MVVVVVVGAGFGWRLDVSVFGLFLGRLWSGSFNIFLQIFAYSMFKRIEIDLYFMYVLYIFFENV